MQRNDKNIYRRADATASNSTVIATYGKEGTEYSTSKRPDACSSADPEILPRHVSRKRSPKPAHPVAPTYARTHARTHGTCAKSLLSFAVMLPCWMASTLVLIRFRSDVFAADGFVTSHVEITEGKEQRIIREVREGSLGQSSEREEIAAIHVRGLCIGRAWSLWLRFHVGKASGMTWKAYQPMTRKTEHKKEMLQLRK